VKKKRRDKREALSTKGSPFSYFVASEEDACFERQAKMKGRGGRRGGEDVEPY